MSGIVCYASLPHYYDHLAPVVEALRSATTPVLRGVEAPRGRPWGEPLRTDRDGTIWLVASYADARRLAPAPVIYLEHGAGQSYHGDPRSASSGSYSGGDGLDHAVLFLCPNETVAWRWRVRYPRTPAVVVGCPKLDRRHSRAIARDPMAPPTVAVSFHWPNSLCPESQWTLPYYRAHLDRLAELLEHMGGQVIGHGHPRAWRQLRREWARHGIEPVASFEDVMDRADLLVVDNSSAGPEFASLGRPIVWLSAPWYRRDVFHGGRFWSWTEGVPHVEHPEDLVPTVAQVLAGGYGYWREGHDRMVAEVYAHRDGRAAQRAADAIMEATASWGTRSHHA